MLAAGWSDGTVVVYNVESVDAIRAVASTAMNGKHILPVCKVSALGILLCLLVTSNCLF